MAGTVACHRLPHHLTPGIYGKRLAVAVTRRPEISENAILPEIRLSPGCSIGKNGIAHNLSGIVDRPRGYGIPSNGLRVQINEFPVIPEERMAVWICEERGLRRIEARAWVRCETRVAYDLTPIISGTSPAP